MYQVTVYTSPSALRQTFTFTRKRDAERCALYNQKKGYIVETDEGIMRRIAQLEAKKAALRAARGNGKLSFKVSDKGGVSVYGLGRFPVTFYKNQWEKILSASEKIQEFIKINEHLLKTK